MTSIIFFIIFVPIIGMILLAINFFLAPHKPYKEKKTPFECGFHSFVGQNRKQFSVIFFIYSIMFMIFDLELFFAFPLGVSIGLNDALGISTLVIFFIILTLGFVFELGSNALNLDTKQVKSSFNPDNGTLNRFAIFVVIISFCLFKYLSKVVSGCSEDIIYASLFTCLIASAFSCIIFVVRRFCKNDYNFGVSHLATRFAYTFIIAILLHLLAYFKFIDLNIELLLDFFSLLLGWLNAIPVIASSSNEPFNGILKMEGKDLPLSSKSNSSDVIDRISETGFIDDEHMDLACKVQEPEEGISFQQYQQDVKKLRDYVDQKDLGPNKIHWRKRDDELIAQSRAMYASELLANTHRQTWAEDEKKRNFSEKDSTEQSSSKRIHNEDDSSKK